MFEVHTLRMVKDSRSSLDGATCDGWTRIFRSRKKAEAIAAAEAAEFRAVVTRDGTSDVLFSNNKPPGIRYRFTAALDWPAEEYR